MREVEIPRHDNTDLLKVENSVKRFGSLKQWIVDQAASEGIPAGAIKYGSSFLVPEEAGT